MRYVFRISLERNPTSTPDPNWWTLEYSGRSFRSRGFFEGFKIVAPTPAPTMSSMLPLTLNSRLVNLSAEQDEATGRNDTTGIENNLVFMFEVSKRPHRPEDLAIRAPDGFEFPQRCEVITDISDVFGVYGYITVVDRGFTAWPKRAIPTSCSGSGDTAYIRIPVGLAPDALLVFRIAVKNPTFLPTVDTWQVSFMGERSIIDGFEILGLTAAPTPAPPPGNNTTMNTTNTTTSRKPKAIANSAIQRHCSSGLMIAVAIFFFFRHLHDR